MKLTFWLLLLASISVLEVLACVPPAAEHWRCAVELGAGLQAELTFERQLEMINGNLKGSSTPDNGPYTIMGRWQEGKIYFLRLLSEARYERFEGAVMPAGAAVAMKGSFGITPSRSWSAKCEQVGTEKAQPSYTVSGLIAPPLFDFVAGASAAEWFNNSVRLPFPGSREDKRGWVRVENTALEDCTTRQVLVTHPDWDRRGLVIGRYSGISIPADGAEFRAAIGFLHGALPSDGAVFEVRGEFPHYNGIQIRREFRKNYSLAMTEFSQDLSRFRGLKGVVELRVDAGERSASDDWAAWVYPRLVPVQNAEKRPMFIGGAVGSRHEGERLINAWAVERDLPPGQVMVYLAFANLNRSRSVRLDSYRDGEYSGSKDLLPIGNSCWVELSHPQQGEWKEIVVLNDTYVGEIRYQLQKIGE